MKLIGTFTEAQLRAKEDRAARKRAEEESGGVLRYFTTKLKKRRGVIVAMELYGMTTEEYVNSDII